MFTKSIKELALKFNKVSHYSPGIASAQILNHPTDIANTPEKIQGILGTASNWVFAVFLAVAVIGLVYTAFMYLTAAGDMDTLKNARTS